MASRLPFAPLNTLFDGHPKGLRLLAKRVPQLSELSMRSVSRLAGLLKLRGALALLVVGLLLSKPLPASVRLALLGDLMLGRGVAERLPINSTFPLALLTGELWAADLALGNLESPLTEAPMLEPSGYDLRADSAAAAGLATSGLDVLSIANNHSLDCGPAGLADTRAALANAGLVGIAAGDPSLRYRLRGMEVVILAYDAVTQPLDLEAVAATIKTEKQSGAVVIVSLHWGGEFRPAPDPVQRAAAQVLAQAGADLIWGHHPHVLQPVEWVTRPQFSRPALVIYSLGNTLFDQEAPPDARWGALLTVRLEAEGVSEMKVRPFEIDLRHAGLQEPDTVTTSRILERLQLP